MATEPRKAQRTPLFSFSMCFGSFFFFCFVCRSFARILSSCLSLTLSFSVCPILSSSTTLCHLPSPSLSISHTHSISLARSLARFSPSLSLSLSLSLFFVRLSLFLSFCLPLLPCFHPRAPFVEAREADEDKLVGAPFGASPIKTSKEPYENTKRSL